MKKRAESFYMVPVKVSEWRMVRVLATGVRDAVRKARAGNWQESHDPEYWKVAVTGPAKLERKA